MEAQVSRVARDSHLGIGLGLENQIPLEKYKTSIAALLSFALAAKANAKNVIGSGGLKVRTVYFIYFKNYFIVYDGKYKTSHASLRNFTLAATANARKFNKK